MKMYRTLLILFTLIGLTCCSSVNLNRTGNQALFTAQDYITLARNTTGTTQQQYLLQAAQTYLNNHQTNLANDVLKQLDPEQMSPPQLIQQKLLIAQTMIYAQQFQSALTLLNQNQQNLNKNQQVLWYRLSANANVGLNNIPQAILLRTALAPLLQNNNTAYQKNCQRIWLSLQNMTPSQLQTLDSTQTDPAIKGWADLAVILKQTDSSPEQLIAKLNQWKSAFPSHLAQALFPSQLHSTLINHSKIALLLPLSGAYADSGKAIRNGFFSAYYFWKSRLKSPPNMTVINTSKQGVTQAYQQALQEGATLIVGPLTKTNINTLVSSTKLTVPTLALNTVSSSEQAITNLFQFGLSPADEIQQAANKAWQDQHSRAIIIASNTGWGKNLASVLKTTWLQRGGSVMGELNYDNGHNLANQIQRILNIDQAKQRAIELRQLLKMKFRYTPRHRKDFDSIFFIGSNKIAKQVRPLLKYYYAGNIPLYAISPVYQGSANRRRDRDLNGILFCDIPWVLSSSGLKPPYLQTIKNNIHQLWGSDARRHPKLYALGVDAFDLTLRLNKMLILPLLGTNAATGTLYLQPDHRIYRQLQWAKFSGGLARKIDA